MPREATLLTRLSKRNSVVAPKQDRAALEALADAALETDVAKRWPRLEQALDVDRFVDFMAMEVMVGHRDGYCLARNNYRVYHDIDSDRMVFFPHGMDQLFGNPGATWLPHLTGLAAKAVMDGRKANGAIPGELLHLCSQILSAVQLLHGRVDQVGRWPSGPAITDAEFASVRDEAAHLKATESCCEELGLKRHVGANPIALLVFTNGESDTSATGAAADDSDPVQMGTVACR